MGTLPTTYTHTQTRGHRGWIPNEMAFGRWIVPSSYPVPGLTIAANAATFVVVIVGGTALAVHWLHLVVGPSSSENKLVAALPFIVLQRSNWMPPEWHSSLSCWAESDGSHTDAMLWYIKFYGSVNLIFAVSCPRGQVRTCAGAWSLNEVAELQQWTKNWDGINSTTSWEATWRVWELI